MVMVCVGACSDFDPVVTARISGGDGAAPSATVNGCTADMYADRTSPSADRTVGFGGDHGSTGFTFAPKCIAITAGQDVTFSGAFATHPLSAGLAGGSPGGSPGNPIPGTATGTSVTVRFPVAGVYPFTCTMHGLLGMNGAVLVR